MHRRFPVLIVDLFCFVCLFTLVVAAVLVFHEVYLRLLEMFRLFLEMTAAHF